MPWSASAALARVLARNPGTDAEQGVTESDANPPESFETAVSSSSRAAREQRLQLESKQKPTGKSSRRKGMIGDHAFRSELRQARSRIAARERTVEVLDSDEEQQPSENRLVARVPTATADGGAADSDVDGDTDLLHIGQRGLVDYPYLAKVCQAGDFAQQKLLLLSLAAASSSSATAGKKNEEVEIAKTLTNRLLFNPERRFHASLSVEAASLEVDRSTLRKHIQVAAAAVVDAATNSWSGFLAWVQQRAREGRLKLHCLIRQRCYDETPLRFRVSEATSETDKSRPTTVVKVLQTRFSMGMILEPDPAQSSESTEGNPDPKLVFLHGYIPVSLQPLERTRAPDILKTQMEILDSIPGIRQLTKAFPSTVNVATADRFSGNLLAAAELHLFSLPRPIQDVGYAGLWAVG